MIISLPKKRGDRYGIAWYDGDKEGGLAKLEEELKSKNNKPVKPEI